MNKMLLKVLFISKYCCCLMIQTTTVLFSGYPLFAHHGARW